MEKQIQTFNDLPLLPEVQKALELLNITTPTEIQSKAIPALLNKENVDLHGQAQTGTGKTFAFGIPLLHKIDLNKKHVQALVVAPTRELVVQISDSLKQLAKFMKVSICPIYGGVSLPKQMQDLRRGAHIVIGTPGRLNDHLKRKTLSLSALDVLVLDEADIMLEMGFKEEVDEILSYAPANRAIWLFSATIKDGVAQLMKNMKNPISIRAASKVTTTNNTKQYYCIVPSGSRMNALCRFIDSAPEFYGMIFCRTKALSDELAEKLIKLGYNARALHGDMNQTARNKVIEQFRKKGCTILVATNVAARGIDVAGLTHVINYSMPDDLESYVHRIGRTGRAGKEGIAITFITNNELRAIKHLTRMFGAQFEQLQVPQMTDIMPARIEQAAEHLKSVLGRKVHNPEIMEKLSEVVAQHSQEELVTIVAQFLSEKFLKDIRSADVDQKETQEAVDASQEISIGMGSQDGITEDDIMGLLLASEKVTESDIEKIRVIKHCTFIIVPGEKAYDLVDTLRGQNLNGKKVRAEVVHGGGERNKRREGRGGGRNFGRGGDRKFGGRGGDRDRGNDRGGRDGGFKKHKSGGFGGKRDFKGGDFKSKKKRSW